MSCGITISPHLRVQQFSESYYYFPSHVTHIELSFPNTLFLGYAQDTTRPSLRYKAAKLAQKTSRAIRYAMQLRVPPEQSLLC